MTWLGSKKEQTEWIEARDALVKLMGSRQADNLIAQLESAGFKVVRSER